MRVRIELQQRALVADLPARRLVDAGEQSRERALAATALAHQRHDLVAVQHEVDVVDGVQEVAREAAAHLEVLGEPANLDQRCRHVLATSSDSAAAGACLRHRACDDPTTYSSGSTALQCGISTGQRGMEPAPGRRIAQLRRPAGDPAELDARSADGREGVEQPAGVGMRRLVEHRARRAELDDLTRVHHDEPLREVADERHVVRDEQDRESEPLLQLLDLHHQRALRNDVERGRRLVHDDEVGSEEQRHRDHRPLPHAAAELVRVAAQVDGVDADELEDLDRPGLDLGLRARSVRDHRVAELRADGGDRVQRVHRALHDHGQVLPAQHVQLPVRHRDQVLTAELDRAGGDRGGRGQQPRDREQQRGLPAAGLADHPDEFSRRDIEVDVVDGDAPGRRRCRIRRRGRGPQARDRLARRLLTGRSAGLLISSKA